VSSPASTNDENAKKDNAATAGIIPILNNFFLMIIFKIPIPLLESSSNL
jgi:hypothetical protein